MRIDQLNDAIAAVCPIEGMNSNGDIWFRPEATDEQRESAQALMSENLPSLDLSPVPPLQTVTPTLAELQAQLATLTAQINSLTGGK